MVIQPKVTGSLVTRLGSMVWTSAQYVYKQALSNAEVNSLNHFATLILDFEKTIVFLNGKHACVQEFLPKNSSLVVSVVNILVKEHTLHTLLPRLSTPLIGFFYDTQKCFFLQ